MPARRKGANLSRQKIKSRSMQFIRAQRSGEQVQQSTADQRARMVQLFSFSFTKTWQKTL